jgi:hypothetical protein
MTRLWVNGDTIRVMLEAGLPVRFVWNGRAHPVQHVANQWRLDVGWWRFRLWRDYYKVVTATGLLVIIYHDLTSDQWGLQRVYD